MNLKQLAKAANKKHNHIRNGEKEFVAAYMEDYIDLGELLIAAKEQADDYTDWVDTATTLDIPQASRYIRIATHKEQARQLTTDQDLSIEKLQKLLPKTVEAPVVTSADPKKLAYVGRQPTHPSRNADDWHTPSGFTEAARRVMGSIDLDPFTSIQANQKVGAERIYTLADDAFARVWADPETRTVWMNPPYSKGASSNAVDKFLEEYDHGSFDEGVVLMNASTDTNWFHRMINVASAVCLTKGRIAFEDAGGKSSAGNTKGQVFFYFGKNTSRFHKEFEGYGYVFNTGVV